MIDDDGNITFSQLSDINNNLDYGNYKFDSKSQKGNLKHKK